jgi:hypothetical protein
VLGTPATDSISVTEIEPRLAIEAEVSHFFLAAQHKLNYCRIWDNQRPVG